MKNTLLFFAFTVISFATYSGDEFRVPNLLPGSEYESAELNYRVVGIEQSKHATTIFVVANRDSLLVQINLNHIIKDIIVRLRNQKGKPEFTEIWFYSSVKEQLGAPAFLITEHVAVYRPEVNRSYFGVAAKQLYGGWAYGPGE